MYAAGRDHPYGHPCRTVIDFVRTGALAATTSVEVIQEVLNLYLQGGTRADGIRAARIAVRLFYPPLAVDLQDVEAAIDVAERVPALGARDAIHAAMRLRRGLVLISTDRDFDSVPDLQRVDPRDAPDKLVKRRDMS